MDNEDLKEIIVEQNNYFHRKEKTILREKFEKIKELKKIPHIIIISGLRRAGKSTLLEQINKNLYPNQKLAYLNFEDEKLLNFNVYDFNRLYESFLELDSQKKVFFFDEIQNLKDWEIAIRKLYEKKIKFYITGSNASMLSKELGTKLTGRHINITLYPFSFREFLEFNNLKINENDIYLSEKKAKIKFLFNLYLLKGGIPEYLKYERKEIIKQVYEDILYKDILVRYNLTDERTLRELSKYLLSNVGKEFSYNKLKTMLGLGSSNTVKSYISYLENSYLIFQLEKFDYSLKKQILNPKKIYTIDPAFIENVSFKFSEDRGRLLENLVFIELKRRDKEIYYHREKKECDFLIKEKNKIIKAIQVTKSISNPETKKREIDGLMEAMEMYNLKDGLILTEDEEFTIKEQDSRIKGFKELEIKIMPIWKWLLDES